MPIADLAAETARAAQGSLPSANDVAVAERSLLRLLAPGGGARASLTSAVQSALRAHLLAGSSVAARAALRRCGGEAAELDDDVARLAAALGRIAVVSFRVHGPWLDLATQNILE